jgi:hypothetical protein
MPSRIASPILPAPTIASFIVGILQGQGQEQG